MNGNLIEPRSRPAKACSAAQNLNQRPWLSGPCLVSSAGLPATSAWLRLSRGLGIGNVRQSELELPYPGANGHESRSRLPRFSSLAVPYARESCSSSVKFRFVSVKSIRRRTAQIQVLWQKFLGPSVSADLVLRRSHGSSPADLGTLPVVPSRSRQAGQLWASSYRRDDAYSSAVKFCGGRDRAAAGWNAAACVAAVCVSGSRAKFTSLQLQLARILWFATWVECYRA
jgi:hypothetical protein